MDKRRLKRTICKTIIILHNKITRQVPRKSK
jgi:hypothetical protein